MAGGLVIPLSLNPREWLRGIRVVERSLQDVEGDLGDVEDAGDRLERALKDNFDDIGRSTSEGIKGAEKQAGRAAGALAGEIVDEFVENWGEAVRSGDYAGAVRETLSQLGQIGGAVGGPAGALIGGALALGLTTAFDNALAADTRVRESLSNILDSVAGSGELKGREAYAAFRRGFTDAANIDEQLVEATGTADIAEAYRAITEVAQQTGLAVDTVAQAYLGQSEAIDQVTAAQGLLDSQVAGMAGTVDQVTGAYGEQLTTMSSAEAVLRNQSDAMKELLGTANEQKTANAEALQLYKDREAVIDGVLSAEADLVVTTRAARTETGLLTGTAEDLRAELAEAGVGAKQIKDQLAGIPKSQRITVYVDYVETGRPRNRVPRG